MIVDAPWYVPNMFIRKDLQIPIVKEEIRRYSSQYSARLSAHPKKNFEFLCNAVEECFLPLTSPRSVILLPTKDEVLYLVQYEAV
jgi:hypothetical protein